MTAWQKIVTARRKCESQLQAEAARREVANAHPALRLLAERNATLAEVRAEMAKSIGAIPKEVEQNEKRLAKLREDFEKIKEKVKYATSTIGLLLRKQRDQLPDTRALSERLRFIETEMPRVQLDMLEYEEEREKMGDPETSVEEVIDGLDGSIKKYDPSYVKQMVRELLDSKRKYLDDLLNDYNAYLEDLGELELSVVKLTAQTEAYANFISENVLWVQSAPPVGRNELTHAAAALAWLGEPAHWGAGAGAVWRDITANPLLYVLALALLAPLIYYQRHLRARISSLGEQAAKGACSDWRPTLKSLVLTVLVAIGWPALLFFLSWRVRAPADAPMPAKAVASGLYVMARGFLMLEILRQVFRSKGLAIAHFGWSAPGIQRLRKQVKWFMMVGLPLGFLCGVMEAQDNERWRNSLGRFAFVTVLLLLAFFLQAAFRPSRGVLRDMLARFPNGWLNRLRYLWYPTLVVGPLALVVLTLVGYLYTSQQLLGLMMRTAWLLLLLLLVSALMLRWILVNRRKIAIEQARQRRDAAAAAAAGSESAAATPVAPEPKLDLTQISGQTRKLLQSSLALAAILGVWLIWVDVLPALSVLKRVQLWETSVQVVETGPASDLKATTPTGPIPPEYEWVTLADAALSAIVVIMMMIAARNIPGLLEIAVLQRLPLDAGARYAISTVSRYLITIVGLLVACKCLGLGWSNVQWLVAAISVGLGFGLQEIFANFVSGLILLLERPIRVGDVVTVDDVTGAVTRIRMRATTITNWDRKELVVPNREFITGRLLNWTLSDQVNRVTINVGVAYGSDTELARNLLLKVADEHPIVLNDPPPSAVFEGFGDSTLNIALRVYLPNLENRLQTVHELHTTIDKLFRQASIEIAFPQRDLHIRSFQAPLPVAAVAAPHSNGAKEYAQGVTAN